MDLLVVTSSRQALDVLPALELLSHRTQVISPRVADYMAQPACDAVLVDARVQPFFACELTGRLLATGRAEPIIGVISTAVAEDLSPHCAVVQLVMCDAGPAEVEARLRLAVPDRRHPSEQDRCSAHLAIGPLRIDPECFEATVGDRRLVLTHREFELLATLALHAGRMFARWQLLDMVWGQDEEVHPRTVDSHIRVLRAKLGPTHRGLIRTARGIGYGILHQSIE